MAFIDQFSLDTSLCAKFKKLATEKLITRTENKHNEASRLEKYISDLKEQQSELYEKNRRGIISESVLKELLSKNEGNLMSTYGALAKLPTKKKHTTGLIDLIIEFLKNPSVLWLKARFEIKLQLQWFEFPKGITFENGKFRTAEICSLFKLKECFSTTLSANVDPIGFEPMTSSLQMRRSTN